MNRAFSNAAIERIARVVQIPAKAGEVLAAADFLRRPLKEEPAREIDVLKNFYFGWTGGERDPMLRLVSFAGLLELGIQAGYLSIEGWECAPLLQEALTPFAGLEAEGSTVDLRLLGGLLRRLTEEDFAPQAEDEAAFAAFESYLHLTSRLRTDDAALAFLAKTHAPRLLGGRLDRAALLSPRHFAEAFATGAIAGLQVTDVAAGIAVLRYFGWLAEILETLAPDSELRADIICHARWAQGAARVQARFGAWADLMSEWSESPADQRADWTATADRLFGSLIGEPERKEAASETTTEEQFEITGELAIPVAQRAAQLAAEGRRAAACELILDEASAQLRRLRPDLRDWLDRVETLVEHARSLEKLGNPDAAGAILAPVIPTLIEQHGRSGYKLVADALEIVQRARQGEPRSQEQEQQPPARSVEAPGVKAEEETDSRILGEPT